MTHTELWRQRLHQQTRASTYKTPLDVVSWLGAVQAQDYLGSLWAIGLRLATCTEDAVEQAIAHRSFVRTWPMRGTLHFVPSENVRWMLKYLTPRIIQRSAIQYKQAELDNKIFLKSRKVIEK